jgi:hypothetical protein
VSLTNFPLVVQERFGYDNICLKAIPGCGNICEPEPLCTWKYEGDCRRYKGLKKWEEVMKQVRYFDKDTCICAIMENCCPDRCDMAEQEFLAVLLNVASGKLDKDCCVDDCVDSLSQGQLENNVALAISKMDEIMSKTPRSDYDCAKVIALAAGINEGETTPCK